MSRQSKIIKCSDTSGDYEQEIFDPENPKHVMVCVHGNGVRRWDGEKFFYQLAEHFTDSVVALVDQNQPEGDGVKLNDFQVIVARIQRLVDYVSTTYPNVPILVVGHSMGCPISCQLDLSNVSNVLFIAPAVGAPEQTMIERYGSDIAEGKKVFTSERLTKIIPKSFYDSIKGLVWEDEYKKLVARFSPVHVFESGDDEIVGEGRFVHRTIPFTSYEIIKGAKHNFAGKYSQDLFSRIEALL